MQEISVKNPLECNPFLFDRFLHSFHPFTEATYPVFLCSFVQSVYHFLLLAEVASLVSLLPLTTCCSLPWLYLEFTLMLNQTDWPVISLLLPLPLLHGLLCYLPVLAFSLDTLNL